ncbi:hypothetical protein ELH91_32810 [Rhizobium leguminosarum]|uniref:hypothetical protein n=1 Tax=Rhizobium leguminosarum TaxID=384 RepID=UPI00103096AD|nr:hypothetical protein [Rhizobium leguminosarum]TAY05624.1 hypothetical protein ELH91_32810 [Rhizobium leguminosarum]
MSIMTIRTLTARSGLGLAWILLSLLTFHSVSHAPTPPTPPVQEKVDQLLKLLDDPDVKAMLAAKASEPVAETSMGVSASDFMTRSDAIRAHLGEIEDAIPAVPGEFSRARSTIMTEINGHRPRAILIVFIAFAALGFGAEFVSRRLIDRGGRGSHAYATTGPVSRAWHWFPFISFASSCRERTPIANNTSVLTQPCSWVCISNV